MGSLLSYSLADLAVLVVDQRGGVVKDRGNQSRGAARLRLDGFEVAAQLGLRIRDSAVDLEPRAQPIAELDRHGRRNRCVALRLVDHGDYRGWDQQP